MLSPLWVSTSATNAPTCANYTNSIYPSTPSPRHKVIPPSPLPLQTSYRKSRPGRASTSTSTSPPPTLTAISSRLPHFLTSVSKCFNHHLINASPKPSHSALLQASLPYTRRYCGGFHSSLSSFILYRPTKSKIKLNLNFKFIASAR
jgi:hypothetical protein